MKLKKPVFSGHSQTLKDAFDSRKDNFLFIRMFAATMVIYGHSYAISDPPQISGQDIFARFIGGTYSGTIAVQMFFLISGFLITASYLNRNDIFFYIRSRVLRIFPALIVSVTISALVIGPVFTTIPLTDYFTDFQVYKYIYTNILLVTNEWFLPQVFTDNPMRAVNGSLWTLPAEGRMYVMVGLLGVIGVLRSKLLFNIVACTFLILGIFYPSLLFMVGHPLHLTVMPFFLLGAVFYINRDIIYLNKYVLLALTALCFFTHGMPGFKITFGLFLAYFTIWVCYVPNIRMFNSLGDYSYGLYVYAFPIQQMIRETSGSIHPLELFAYSFIAILSVSILSWHYIEKPMLDLKKLNFRTLVLAKSQA